MADSLNAIGESFSPRTARMLDSFPMRVISLAAHRVLARLEIEVCRSSGRKNGSLVVTHDQFVDYGVHGHSVAPAIRELEALGLIEVTQEGRAGNAGYRLPNMFRLTFLPTWIGETRTPPTHEWKRFGTLAEAKQESDDARRAKPEAWRVRRAGMRMKPANADPEAAPFGRPRQWRRRSLDEIIGAGEAA